MSKQIIQIHIPRFKEVRCEISGFRSDVVRPWLFWDAARRRLAAGWLELTRFSCHHYVITVAISLKRWSASYSKLNSTLKHLFTFRLVKMSLHWLTTPVFGLQDTLSLLTTVNSLLIRCTAAEQLLNLLTQLTLVLTQCLPTHTRITVAGTGGTRLKKRFSFFNTLCRASGSSINSDRQCVPQLVFPLHRRLYQKVTELQNVPAAMAIFTARPIKIFS